MPKHKILDPERPGKRSGIRRLIYRAAGEGRHDRHGAGNSRWQDNRDWPSIKEQLRLTIGRAPEVIINVKGSRRGKDDDRSAIQGVLRYMMYISRNGRLLTIDERGETIDGREAICQSHASWDLDMQRMRGAKGEPLHPSFNIIFSMPAKTDAGKLMDAVQSFAREHFKNHQYVMALHTPQTDPSKKPPEHPHVHMVVRAEDVDGRRLYIRKGDLRAWRAAFAAELRARGIEANATSRAERGRSLKSIRGAEWHIQKHYEESLRCGRPAEPPKAKLARFLEVARELQEGRIEPKPWEQAMAARRRDVLRNLKQSVERLREEGDNELADQVETYIEEMPAPDSERRLMQHALLAQVRKRMQEQGRDVPKESER